MPTDETAGAEAIEATLRLLSPYEGTALTLNVTKGSVEAVALRPDTFSITVYDQGDEAMVAAGSWHSHYDDPVQAAWCVFWLLTPFYRLLSELKNGVLVATWIERYEASGWEGMEPVFFLNPDHDASWEARSDVQFQRRIQQQAVLRPLVDYRTIVPGAILGADGQPPDSKTGTRTAEDRDPKGILMLREQIESLDLPGEI